MYLDDLRTQISLEHLSHAYIVEAEREEGTRALQSLLQSFGISTVANPDYHEYQFETLLIEHARELRRAQGLRGADGAKKIFVVAFNAITSESQNALLKTLEEPTEGTHFFFLVRTSALLLPTVRSRMQLVRIATEEGTSGEVTLFAEKFLAASVSERMKMVERMTKAKTDDKPKAKEEARVFVGALEELLYENFKGAPREYFPSLPRTARNDFGHPSENFALALEDIITTKRELSDRSPSTKLLLEFLALTLPTKGVP